MPGRVGLPSQDWGTFHGRSESWVVAQPPVNSKVIRRNGTLHWINRRAAGLWKGMRGFMRSIEDEIAHRDRHLLEVGQDVADGEVFFRPDIGDADFTHENRLPLDD